MADSSAWTPSAQLAAHREALRLIADGRRIGADSFIALKRDGFVGGTRALPAITARGRSLLAAQQDSAHGESGAMPMVLPDVLVRLARPRRNEAALLGAEDIEAARRFQRDLTRAQLGPRITQNWSVGAMAMAGSGGTPASRQGVPDFALDARARVHAACTSVGPEFAGLLVDVCLFEKPLALIETERQWPARSGKLAVALGLKALARFYGLDRVARGPDRRR